MLTRPLAYKGPADHLSQYFSLANLYQGMQVLLQDLMMDWRFSSDKEFVEGFFLEQDRLIKAQLGWPLGQAIDGDFCECKKYSASEGTNCEHLSALAIDTKMRLERLPQPIKQAKNFANELAYLSDWLTQQSFDPFPNMARHRVVYILDGEPGQLTVTLHKAYLTQQNEYQRKASLELSLLNKGKLPKFISLTDQQIIHIIGELVSQSPSVKVEDFGVQLSLPDDTELLRKMVLSGRCFWRSCHRHPLNWHYESAIEQDWWTLSETLALDKSHSRLVDLKGKLSEPWHQALLLLKRDPQKAIVPCLTISSEQLYFPWRKMQNDSSALVELDAAMLRFQVGDFIFGLNDVLQYIGVQHGKVETEVVERIAAIVHQLDWLPSIAANFEPPILQSFDIGDRFLNGDFSHWFVLFRGLQSEGWQVQFDKQFHLNQRNVDQWYSKVATSGSGANISNEEAQEWFELELGVVVEGQSINILPYVVEALQRGQWQNLAKDQDVTITVADGTRLQLEGHRIQKILANLVELSERQPLSNNKRLKLPSNQFSRLLTLESQFGQKTDWQDLNWLKEKVRRLKKLKQPRSVEMPANLNAELRDYQKQGLDWLQLLRQENLGGILADDMGLGKTLQTLAHIQLEKNSGRMSTPVMVVAPTSLLGNWVQETKRFTPQLQVLQWSGNKRQKLIGELESADLIVTSYGVLLRDAELLNSLNLYYLVLDEAQTIKNARSRIARLTYAMTAQNRLCLTGTPLENHLGELWSLFHFLMPGFLGEEAQFKRLFRQPIEKDNDFQRQKVLSQRVAPFMLRRTKSKVATDLPAKTVINETIELSETQADLYESVRLSMLQEVQKALAETGAGRNHLLIGNALLRLRQICCHPALIQTDDKSMDNESSAKLNWLLTVLPEMIESGRKILLFSSFTSMLEIIATQLDELNIVYLKLTGQTRRRSELVAKFQSGQAPVFLISLKAGGAGLNLTQADTVIHFDPWWNPAAEEQASDRAHRIGQNKPVFVYKLISQGTVEERIQTMQSKKSELAQHLFQQQQSKDLFSQPNWEALLAPLEED